MGCSRNTSILGGKMYIKAGKNYYFTYSTRPIRDNQLITPQYKTIKIKRRQYYTGRLKQLLKG